VELDFCADESSVVTFKEEEFSGLSSADGRSQATSKIPQKVIIHDTDLFDLHHNHKNFNPRAPKDITWDS
jgi:hypothetical protein